MQCTFHFSGQTDHLSLKRLKIYCISIYIVMIFYKPTQPAFQVISAFANNSAVSHQISDPFSIWSDTILAHDLSYWHLPLKITSPGLSITKTILQICFAEEIWITSRIPLLQIVGQQLPHFRIFCHNYKNVFYKETTPPRCIPSLQ